MTALAGKVGLVTGASKGIGLEVARAMVRHGMSVVLTARNEAEVREAADALTREGPGRAVGVRADVRAYDDLEAAVSEAAERFGGLDVLVANAGVGVFKPVQELTLDEWRSVIDTNLTGVFLSVKAAVGELAKRRGTVVTISSLAARNPFAGGAAYNASKFGLNGFTEAIMLDLRALGVKVSTVMPGSVATHFGGREPGEADAWKIQPEDIAQVVIDLLEMPARTLPSRVEVRPSQPKR